jgi:Cu(I)/Ag(I) efflux system membrane fusion protein
MTDAFVATNAEEVSIHALKVKSGLQNVDMGILQGDDHMEWMNQIGKLNETIDQIANSKVISDQRVIFAEFNNTFYKSLKSFGLHQGTTYYQYCPMANGDVGAYWFSNEKDIENPYFGDEMLKCGETRETLEF